MSCKDIAQYLILNALFTYHKSSVIPLEIGEKFHRNVLNFSTKVLMEKLTWVGWLRTWMGPRVQLLQNAVFQAFYKLFKINNCMELFSCIYFYGAPNPS